MTAVLPDDDRTPRLDRAEEAAEPAAVVPAARADDPAASPESGAPSDASPGQRRSAASFWLRGRLVVCVLALALVAAVGGPPEQAAHDAPGAPEVGGTPDSAPIDSAPISTSGVLPSPGPPIPRPPREEGLERPDRPPRGRRPRPSRRPDDEGRSPAHRPVPAPTGAGNHVRRRVPAAAPRQAGERPDPVGEALARYAAGDLPGARLALAGSTSEASAAPLAARLEAIERLLGARRTWPPPGGAAALERLLELEAGLGLPTPTPVAVRAAAELVERQARKGHGLADEARWSEARDAFVAALAREPDHPAARAGLARVEEAALGLYLEGYVMEEDDPAGARARYLAAARLADPRGALARRVGARLAAAPSSAR